MKKATIELITAPGCSKCIEAKTKIINIIKSYKNLSLKEIDITKQPDIITKYNIMSTPAIVINGVLEFTSVPSEKEFRTKIENILKRR